MLWKILVAVFLIAVSVGILVERSVTDSEVVTIAEVRAGGIRQGAITLKGTITYANNNTFILDDGTGQAELSTCPVWYERVDLRHGDKVMVVGEVMRNPSFSLKSDFVLSVYKIFREGEVILIRRRPGKPPWSSFRLPGDQTSAY